MNVNTHLTKNQMDVLADAQNLAPGGARRNLSRPTGCRRVASVSIDAQLGVTCREGGADHARHELRVGDTK